MLSSYSDVFGVCPDPQSDEDIRVGDLVRSGPNHFPHFEVIAVRGDKAWVRDVSNGGDHLVGRSRCRRIEPSPLPLAAQ